MLLFSCLSYQERWHCAAMTERLHKGKSSGKRGAKRKRRMWYNLSVSLTLDSSPGRGASGETERVARTAKASPTRRGGIAQQ